MNNALVGYLSTAWEAANAAGEIIRANRQQPKNIDYKGAIDLARIIHATRKPDDTLLIEVRPWRNEGTGANVSFCARRSARCLTFSLLIS